ARMSSRGSGRRRPGAARARRRHRGPGRGRACARAGAAPHRREPARRARRRRPGNRAGSARRRPAGRGAARLMGPVAGGLRRRMLDAGARLYGAGWEIRRRAYARGLRRPRAVPARVVSVGNLTVGGTGKTTLTLELARRARERGVNVAVVCRRYHPGPEGSGDEERLYRRSLGTEPVYAGRSKREGAARAAAEGRSLVLVDDGFSHWTLARDLDLVLLDAADPWGGGRLLPAGRLREPRRALQRAGVLVVSRVAPEQDPATLLTEIARVAPAALLAAGRHRVAGVRWLDGAPRAAAGPARLVTATGNPRAVARSVAEAGFEPIALSA